MSLSTFINSVKIEIQAQIEEEEKRRELERIRREKELAKMQKQHPEAEPEDGDFEERRKKYFNVRENLENRKEKNSLLDESINIKVVS